MSAVERIEKLALALPLRERVSLAQSLLSSVPPMGEETDEAEEVAEVERREADIESGRVKPMTEAEFWEAVESCRKK